VAAAGIYPPPQRLLKEEKCRGSFGKNLLGQEKKKGVPATYTLEQSDAMAKARKAPFSSRGGIMHAMRWPSGLHDRPGMLKRRFGTN
jgi:hypothetical protein